MNKVREKSKTQIRLTLYTFCPSLRTDVTERFQIDPIPSFRAQVKFQASFDARERAALHQRKWQGEQGARERRETTTFRTLQTVELENHSAWRLHDGKRRDCQTLSHIPSFVQLRWDFRNFWISYEEAYLIIDVFGFGCVCVKWKEYILDLPTF